jgi:membrane protease YdiL (CAAX protease family)
MTTLSSPSSTPQRLLAFPVTRIIIAALCVMVPFLLVQGLAFKLLEHKSLLIKVCQFLGICCSYALYCYYVRKVEKRDVSELSRENAAGEFFGGALIGALMVATIMAVLAAIGVYHVTAINSPSVMIAPLIMHLTVGMMEELLMRAIFFRIIERSLGSVIALLLSALAFGAGHLVNENVSVLGIATVVAAGLLLAAAYMNTGRLWMCVGMHAAWNFVQGGVFSAAVSGGKVHGLLESSLSGPDWLTGGAFGVEGSVLSLLVTAAATVVLLMRARRNGRVVLPYWKRAA